MTYMSIEASFRSNGDRHARKAEYWREQGKPDYAEGSMRKAYRNWTRADAWKIPVEFRSLYDATKIMIDKQLYEHGTGGNPLQGFW